MIRFLNRYSRPITFFLIVLHASQLGTTSAFALTSGPTQPEVQGFQAAGTTEMVDLFSGDFSYNIPLFELPGPNGGYPFSLSYQAGIGMDQEASFVGLGWNLNPGTINRQMRGLPDEFKGDSIGTKTAIEPNVTVGMGLGVGIEVFGGDLSGEGTNTALSASLGFSVYRNNYRGIGYTIDNTVGFGMTTGSQMTAGIGLSASVDTKEGVGLAPSLNLGYKTNGIGLRAGYNSKEGLNTVTMSFDRSRQVAVNDRKDKVMGQRRETFFSGSASLSFAHPTYTPQISMPMQNSSMTGTFKIGGAFWGIYGDAYVTGFYNEQRLKNNRKKVWDKAFGYLNYQHATGDRDMMDFNREKDGMVSTVTPNLPIPSLTYDIYSVTGQGISATYRPMRNDIGIIRDQEVESTSTGASAGVDIGIPAHVGVNLSLNHARSLSGAWKGDKNEFRQNAKMQFQNEDLNKDYQPVYFKAHGEASLESSATLDGIGGANAVRVKLDEDTSDPVALNRLQNDRGYDQSTPENYSRERKSRNQVIESITNEQLLNGNVEVNPLFKVTYDSAGLLKSYSRRPHPKHHTAGFTALTPEGLRYVYAIPAYNLKQEEVTFSGRKNVNDVTRVEVTKPNSLKTNNDDPDYDYQGTDKYLNRVEMPKFAHSFLLTSIVGPDYVDVRGDGVTPDDLGYWVKFTYRRTSGEGSPYKWRDPFTKAHYQEGWKTDPRDDRGSFVYGEKEVWYLVQAETKSHIASFKLEDRADSRGVFNFLQNGTNKLGSSLKKLSEIKLYTRQVGEDHPIKVVRLEHDNSLCPGIPNNGTGGGKLTLKKLWFEYGGSQRGKLNPYVFDYHEGNANENPPYSPYQYDRWGNYKRNPTSDPLYNIDFPYTDQDNGKQAELDVQAGAWSLKEIKLPSGGKVVVDYETDDYAYVQHKPAMQMAKIVDPFENASNFRIVDDKDSLKVKFRLESTVPGNLLIPQQREVVLRYLDQKSKQIYFKLKVNLRKAFEEDFYEYVSGYADIDFTKPMGLEKDGEDFAYGYFYLVADQHRHPFSIRAWQHMRTNQPDLANQAEPVQATDNPSGRIDQIKSLGSLGDQVRRMFDGYNKYCDDNDWGREIVADKSWIRLNSPDKKKVGGGLRVRQITMMDTWQYDKEGVYGQVYDYTTLEDDETISSGVASYEPIIGGDENALRYAKKFTESVPLRSDNNLFFEYPVNESYYPGAQVGYRKVKVTSLAAASLEAASGNRVKEILHTDLPEGKKLFPTDNGKSFGTSGAILHEFYTAKDFPVIADETPKHDRPHRLNFFIPCVGSVSISKLTSSQGYSVSTNDMHGKPWKVSNYRQDAIGRLQEEPISWVKYNYASDTVVYQGETISVLRNKFKENSDGTLSLLTADEANSSGMATYTLGQENEFFVDMRSFDDIAAMGGARFNMDAIYLLFGVIPIPTDWPNGTFSQTQLRTAVTNKIIFRSGILASTEAYDGGSRVMTRNMKWDKYTGAPVLTAVNNNFDKEVFSYSMLAHKQYEGMGAAYQNSGMKFEISNVDNLPYRDSYYEFNVPGSVKLYPGDEMLLYKPGTNFTAPIAKVVYTGIEAGDKLIFSKTPLAEVKYHAMIIRSGYRNQLSVSAGSITSLEDPTIPGSQKTFTKKITLPKE